MRLLLFALLVATARLGFAACDPANDPDKSDIANARAAVAANCDCAGAARHGDYVRCAAQQIGAVLVNKRCRGRATSCASKSVCGKPGFVTCCRTKNGVTKCGTAKSAAACEAKGGTAGGCSSCCDACPAPGTGPSCPSQTTTSTSSTTTTTGAGGEQCCLRTFTCGPFDTCQVMTSGGCVAAGGFDVGPGDCSAPDACAHASTTTPPFACCVGDQCVFDYPCQCVEIRHGRFLFFQSCSPNPCVTTTTLM